MLTADAHYGGAEFHSSSAVLTRASGRFQSFGSATLISCDLPSPAQFRDDMPFLGRPRFVVLNRGDGDVEIKNGATIVTIGHKEWAALSPSKDGSSWIVMFSGVVDATMDVHASRVGLPANAPVAKTYDPFCSLVDDCRYLSAIGNVPLDGAVGRNTVVAPMYEDVTVHAKNSNREAVRASDVIMPSLVLVEFEDGDFTEDESHPWSGTHSLSEYFFDALYNRKSGSQSRSKPHVLEYTHARFESSGSSDWHHAAHVRTTTPTEEWKHGAGDAVLPARKYVWERVVQYGPPDNPTAFTMVVWFVMQHTLSGDVPVSSPESGPSGDGSDLEERGLWGALYSVMVFTDELNSSFVDSSTTFQPAGWDNAFQWKRKDAAVHALAHPFKDTETSDPETKIGVHPQCVILAYLPTTFESPMERNAVPIVNRSTYMKTNGSVGTNGRTLESCYDVPNGSPWLDRSGCADKFACLGSTWPDFKHGIYQNIVFGRPEGSPTYAMGKGMSTGGGMRRSKPEEWLCFYNSASGIGLTFLKPARPGWDLSCGRLDIAGGSSGRIVFCTDDGDCAVGTTSCGDNGEWPQVSGISVCDGHPAEPLGGVGGSHESFRNSNDPQLCDGAESTADCDRPNVSNTTCCVAPADTVATAYEYCVRTVNDFDEECTGSSARDVAVKTYTTTFNLAHSNYDMNPFSSYTTRKMQWVGVYPDPDNPPRDWTYSDSDADLADVLGSFSVGSTSLSVSSTSGTNPIRAIASYDKYSSGGGTPWDWFGVVIEVGVSGVSSVSCGVGMLDSDGNGYGSVVYSSGGDQIVDVCRYFNSGASREVLATHTIAGGGAVNSGSLKYSQQGAQISVSYTPLAGSEVSVSATDAREFYVSETPSYSVHEADSASALLPSFYTESSSGGATFDSFADPAISDTVPKMIAVYGQLSQNAPSINLDARLYDGVGKCDGNSGKTGCGTPPVCGCSVWTETMYRATSGSGSGGDICSKQTFEACDGVSFCTVGPCDEGVVVYHGGPNPNRCDAESSFCVNGQRTYSDQYPVQRPFISFPIPTCPECWDRPSDPDCPGTTPLMCYGIDVYGSWLFACESVFGS